MFNTLHRVVWRSVLSRLPLPRLLGLLRFAGASLKFPILIQNSKFKIQNFQSLSCLPRSLLDIYELSRQGKQARLAIGVKKENGELLAHAWVEAEGEGLDEKDGYKKIGSF